MFKSISRPIKVAIITGIFGILIAIIGKASNFSFKENNSEVSFFVRVLDRNSNKTISDAQVFVISGAGNISHITDSNGLAEFKINFVKSGEIMELSVVYKNINVTRQNFTVIPAYRYDISIDTTSISESKILPNSDDVSNILPTPSILLSSPTISTQAPPTQAPPTQAPPTQAPPTQVPDDDRDGFPEDGTDMCPGVSGPDEGCVLELPTDLPLNIPSVAFVSSNDGNDDIYLSDEVGSFVTNLTAHNSKDILNGHPSWSPNGRSIVFHSNMDNPGGDNFELYILSVDGTGLYRLTDSPGWDGQPVWSPNGRYIAFESTRNGRFEIFLFDITTGNTTLVPTNMSCGYPNWSPDGDSLTFQSGDISGNNIYIFNMSTNITRQLTNDTHDNWMPSWSPDGEYIMFSSKKDGSRDIFKIYLSDSSVSKIISTTNDDWWPIAWSPDSKKIIFASGGDGWWSLYIANADGSNIQPFNENLKDSRWPVWKR
jgi:Tol biopolymer transport system component